MSKPKFVKTYICDHCGESWTLHLVEARNRRLAKDKPMKALSEYAKHVKLEDCIKLLRNKNRGPMGPVGAQGPSGPPGPVGARGVSGPPGPAGPNPYMPTPQPFRFPGGPGIVSHNSDGGFNQESIGRPDPYREP